MKFITWFTKVIYCRSTAIFFVLLGEVSTYDDFLPLNLLLMNRGPHALSDTFPQYETTWYDFTVVYRFLPYVGIVTILMNDYPQFKVSL